MGQGLAQFKVKSSKFKSQAPASVAQIFMSPGLGDALPLPPVSVYV